MLALPHSKNTNYTIHTVMCMEVKRTKYIVFSCVKKIKYYDVRTYARRRMCNFSHKPFKVIR